MATWDITVDGVNLNTLGTQVDQLTGFGKIADRDFLNVSVRGIDGVLPAFGGYQTGSFGMRFWVDGVDRTTGTVPGGSTAEIQYYANISWLLSQFAKDIPMTIAVTMPDGSTRTCKAQLETMSDPESIARNTRRFNMSFKILNTYWEGPATVLTWNSPPDFTALEITNLQAAGSDGFINDAFIIVHGPATTPTIYALNAGSYTTSWPFIKLNQNLSSTQTWMADAGLFTSTLTTPPAAAVYNLSNVSYGLSRGSMFRIGPPYRLSVSGISGSGAYLQIGTKPKFF
jgi:hypothetical protein